MTKVPSAAATDVLGRQEGPQDPSQQLKVHSCAKVPQNLAVTTVPLLLREEA